MKKSLILATKATLIHIIFFSILNASIGLHFLYPIAPNYWITGLFGLLLLLIAMSITLYSITKHAGIDKSVKIEVVLITVIITLILIITAVLSETVQSILGGFVIAVGWFFGAASYGGI